MFLDTNRIDRREGCSASPGVLLAGGIIGHSSFQQIEKFAKRSRYVAVYASVNEHVSQMLGKYPAPIPALTFAGKFSGPARDNGGHSRARGSKLIKSLFEQCRLIGVGFRIEEVAPHGVGNHNHATRANPAIQRLTQLADRESASVRVLRIRVVSEQVGFAEFALEQPVARKEN